MNDLAKKLSVKVELTNPNFGEDLGDLIYDSLTTALDKLGFGEESLAAMFFTVRFDVTETGGVAATVTTSPKRG